MIFKGALQPKPSYDSVFLNRRCDLESCILPKNINKIAREGSKCLFWLCFLWKVIHWQSSGLYLPLWISSLDGPHVILLNLLLSGWVIWNWYFLYFSHSMLPFIKHTFFFLMKSLGGDTQLKWCLFFFQERKFYKNPFPLSQLMERFLLLF